MKSGKLRKPLPTIPIRCQWQDADYIPDLVRADNQLPALTNDQVLALQLSQVLGDSWPRGADEIGNVLVAERCSQKRAARFFDSEVGR